MGKITFSSVPEMFWLEL